MCARLLYLVHVSVRPLVCVALCAHVWPCALLHLTAFYLTRRGRPCLDRMSSCLLIGLSHGGGWACVGWGTCRMLFRMNNQFLTFHLSNSSSPLPSSSVFLLSDWFKSLCFFISIIIMMMKHHLCSSSVSLYLYCTITVQARAGAICFLHFGFCSSSIFIFVLLHFFHIIFFLVPACFFTLSVYSPTPPLIWLHQKYL